MNQKRKKNNMTDKRIKLPKYTDTSTVNASHIKLVDRYGDTVMTITNGAYGVQMKVVQKGEYDLQDATADQPTHLVFVYGTLKRGFFNNRLLQDAKFLAECELEGEYAMYSVNGSFPAIVEEEGGTNVHGELYEVKNINELDNLEGVPYMYNRVDAKIEGYTGAEVYLWQEDTNGMEQIEGNKWEMGKRCEIEKK